MSIVFRKKRKASVDVEQETTHVVSDIHSEEDLQLKRRHVEFYHGLAMMNRWLISYEVLFQQVLAGCLCHVALLKGHLHCGLWYY